MDNLTAKQSLARKLDINYSDIANNDVFSDADLQEYINIACQRAWDYRFWDFTEHSKTATLTSTDISRGWISYPTDIQPSSIYYLTINGSEYNKKNFAGYKRFFEASPTATDKYWAEFKRSIFFNANACSAGQVVDIYGKKNFTKLSADGDLLPFAPESSSQQDSGNDAIVLLAYSLALSSDKKKNTAQGQIEETRALGMLATLASQLEQGRASEKPVSTPMFEVPNYYGNRNGTTDRGRFSI